MDKVWLKQQLRRSGKTSNDLAEAIHRDRAVVSRIMNGHQQLSLDQAKIFADEMSVDVDEVLRRAGLADGDVAQAFRPGFSESDVTAWVPEPNSSEPSIVRTVAQAMGADRAGIDVWRIRSKAL